MQLIATRPFRYASRALVAGDRFEARSARDAKLLVYATKKAKFAEPETTKERRAVVPAPAAQFYDDAELVRLRSRAEGLGISVDGRWGVKRLQAEIAAKGAAR